MSTEWEKLVSRSRTGKSSASFDDIAQSEPKSPADLTFRPVHAEDLTIAMIGGFAGACSSCALTGTFNKVHYQDKHSILHGFAPLLEHKDSPMDAVTGMNHRLKYGHDLLNPFEVWSAMAKRYGGNFKAAIQWVRHLVADTFSKEGLPLPGHSFFRDAILKHLGRDWTKYLSIKARDVTGAALVSWILSGHDTYLRLVRKVDIRDTYARYQRNMTAYGTCLVSGLMLGSLNYAALVLLARNSIQLTGVDCRISRELDQSLDLLRKQIEAPPRFGAPFVEMIEEPHGQSYNIEEYREFVGDVPLNGNVLLLT